MGEGRRKNGAEPRNLRAERLVILFACDLGRNFIRFLVERMLGIIASRTVPRSEA